METYVVALKNNVNYVYIAYTFFRWEEVKRVEGWVDGLTLPVDTPNQVVCPASQTDSHGSP